MLSACDDGTYITKNPTSNGGAYIAEAPATDFAYLYNASNDGYTITKYKGRSVNVRIPEKIDGKPVTGVSAESGKYAFFNVQSVYFPESVKVIAGQHFLFYTSKDSLTSVTVSSGTIDFYTFHQCSKLESVTLGEGVIEIGEGAFSGCIGLKSIVIPSSVRSIGKGAFRECVKEFVATYKGKTYGTVLVTTGFAGYSSTYYDLPQEFYDAINGN